MKPDVEPILEVRSLRVSFSRWGQKVRALEGVTFTAAPGEWIAIVGHNGAGKSTLLKAIAAAVTLDAGEITIRGEHPSALSGAALSKLVFMVHQNPALGTASLLTVGENLQVADPNRGGRREKYPALLDEVGLANRIDQPVKVLSGGERQLLALAVAKLRGAPVLLLDEPLAALDPQKVQLCVQMIEAMNSAGATVLQIVHNLEPISNSVHRTLTLSEGRLVANSRRASCRSREGN